LKRRCIIYLAIGALFGVLDFFYLGFIYGVPWQRVFGSSAVGALAARWVPFVILNIGVWLLPVIPIALCEARRSRSRRRAALASLGTWCAAIVAYYLANAAQLAFLGVPGRAGLHISNCGSAHFWTNWLSVLQGDILGGIVEWTPVAVVGGAVVGFLTGFIYLGLSTSRRARQGA